MNNLFKRGQALEVLFLAILGLLQGLCEFLPVSSSGHLVLFSAIFGVQDSLLVSIVLHVATLFAIVVVYYKDIKDWVLHPFSNQAIMIYAATIPTCVIVLLIMPIVNASFGGKYLAICFFVSAVLLFVADYFAKKKQSKPFTLKTAFVMGVAQGLAVFPGISRSGTTISAGLASGADRKDCAKFSFLMSVPIILMSMMLEIFKIIKAESLPSVSVPGLIIGSFIAFVVGVFSIKVMVKITEKLQLKWFSLYLVFIAIMCIIIL